MRSMKLAMFAAAAFTLSAGSAFAGQTTWDTTVNPATNTGGTSYCQGAPGTTGGGCTQINYGNQMTFSGAGGTLQVGAFYVDPGSPSTAISGTNTLQAANLEEYAGAGLGVTSKSTAAVRYTGDIALGAGASFTEDVGNSPGHTIDNQGVYDFVIFKFPAVNYDSLSVVLNMFSTSAYSSGGGQFTYWVGGASAPSTLAGFAGQTLNSLTSTFGFTQLSGTAASSGATDIINPGGVIGPYLIVAASITNASRSDDFKVAAVTGKTTITTPEPSGLLVIGSAGLMTYWVRRRKQRKAA